MYRIDAEIKLVVKPGEECVYGIVSFGTESERERLKARACDLNALKI